MEFRGVLFRSREGEGVRMIKEGYQIQQHGEEDYQEGLELDGLSAFARNFAADYFFNRKDYPSAERMVIGAIEQAPFDSAYYAELWSVLARQKHYSEAAKIFQEYKARLDSLDSDTTGAVFRLKNNLEGYIKEAQTEQAR